MKPKPAAAVDYNPVPKKRGRPAKTKDSDNQKKKTSKWSLKEKKKLLEGLKKHSPNDTESLHNFLPHKSPKEIEVFLEKQRFNIRIKSKHKIKAPIEHSLTAVTDDLLTARCSEILLCKDLSVSPLCNFWQSLQQWSVLVSDLVLGEKKNYTENLSRVMSLAANFEDHPAPSVSTPDYAAIYRCLAAVLQGSALPDLGSLECSVMLDLLHSLVDMLRSHDTEQQRQIMLWKYTLLRGKVDPRDVLGDLEKCRKALTNDFSDFTKTINSSVMNSNEKNSSRADSNNITVSQSSSQQSSDQSDSCTMSHDLPESLEKKKEKETQMGRIGLMPSPVKVSNKKDTSSDQHRDSSVQYDRLETNVAESNLQDKDAESDNVQPKKGHKKQSEIEEKVPKKPKMFTLNPFCIPVHHLKLKPKPKVRVQVLQNEQESKVKRTSHIRQSMSLTEAPAKVSTFTQHKSNLSGIVPGTPGCSTHHTTVVMVERPYTGPQPSKKTAQIQSSKTEVVIVTPGNEEPVDSQTLMESSAIQDVIKQGHLVEEVPFNTPQNCQEDAQQRQEVIESPNNSSQTSQEVIQQNQQVIEPRNPSLSCDQDQVVEEVLHNPTQPIQDIICQNQEFIEVVYDPSEPCQQDQEVVEDVNNPSQQIQQVRVPLLVNVEKTGTVEVEEVELTNQSQEPEKNFSDIQMVDSSQQTLFQVKGRKRKGKSTSPKKVKQKIMKFSSYSSSKEKAVTQESVNSASAKIVKSASTKRKSKTLPKGKKGKDVGVTIESNKKKAKKQTNRKKTAVKK